VLEKKFQNIITLSSLPLLIRNKMAARINKSKLKQKSEHRSKLIEIVFENETFRMKYNKKKVTPQPIGKPEILKRYRAVDKVTPYPYDRTFFRNPRFLTNLEEDIKRISPNSANAYCLSERNVMFSNIGLDNEEYAVQFYII
jgi:hypothetical protein